MRCAHSPASYLEVIFGPYWAHWVFGRCDVMHAKLETYVTHHECSVIVAASFTYTMDQGAANSM